MDYVRFIEPPEGMEFRVFTCSTGAGDPEVVECDYAYIAPVKVGAHHDAGGPLDWCPKCEEYLSLGGTSKVMVVEQSSQQWHQATVEPRR